MRTANELLPKRRPIFLDRERPSSMAGVLVLESPALADFEKALVDVIEWETEAQLARETRRRFEAKKVHDSWERYQGLLNRVYETISTSAYGSDFPAAFWLFHSERVVECCRSLQQRLLREHPELGKKSAARLEYAVLRRFLGRVRESTGMPSAAHRASQEVDDLSIFDNIILHAADVDARDHAAWVDLLDDAKRVYVTINEMDSVLKVSTVVNGRRLGNTAYHLDADLPVYVDFSLGEDVGTEHRLFRRRVKNPVIKKFFRRAFNGKRAETIDGLVLNHGIGAYQLEDRPQENEDIA